MQKYYRERFEAWRRIAHNLASSMETNNMLEILREEARTLIPTSMESCILLLDPEASQYTRPLQCALYDRPVNCLSCKRNRDAVKKAMERRTPVIVSATNTVKRRDGSVVETGPEGAVPVIVDGRILAVVTVVLQPEARLTRRDFFFTRDIAEIAGNAVLHGKQHWEITREKIAISKRLSSLSPFVPQAVQRMVEEDSDVLNREKEKRDVTVLFLDLEDYTRLSARLPESEVNELVEGAFSRFVDPIQRSHGEINETSGDGLMILFTDNDPLANAVNAARAALEIKDMVLELNRDLPPDYGAIHVNMGINSGTALLGLSRFRGALIERMTYTASGQVTNLAARLAGLAKGGEVLVGEETRKRIQGLWPLKERGGHRLKGLEDPVHVYELQPGTAQEA
ncbi:MAG: adenylate/guanylate cyclase domain-containing protein [Thermodesulfobacteriota bacterium]